jgi:hypothetical protein
MARKIIGYLFIIFFILLAISLLALLPRLISGFMGFFKIFSGDLNAEESGAVVGTLVYWAIHIVAMIMFAKYGFKWAKNEKKKLDNRGSL